MKSVRHITSVSALLAGCFLGLVTPTFAAGPSRCVETSSQAAPRGSCALAVSDAVPKARPRAATLADRVTDAIRNGDDASAMAEVQSALAADSRSAAAAPVLVLRGQIEAARGRHLSAIADFTAALKLDPKLVTAFVQRGLVNFRQHNREAASADAEAALQLDKSSASARGVRGIVLAAKGEWDVAMPDIEAAIAGGIDWPEVHNDRGRGLMRKGSAAAALVSFERATALSPKNPVYLVNRGMALRQLNRAADALASYSAAIAAGPGYGPAYVARAEVLEERGSLHAARTDLRTALAMTPGPREPIDAALERIAVRLISPASPPAMAPAAAPGAAPRDPIQGSATARKDAAGVTPPSARRTPSVAGTAFNRN